MWEYIPLHCVVGTNHMQSRCGFKIGKMGSKSDMVNPITCAGAEVHGSLVIFSRKSFMANWLKDSAKVVKT